MTKPIQLSYNIRHWKYYRDPDTMLVLQELMFICREHDGDEFEISKRLIEQSTGVSERKIKTALARLQEEGIAVIRSGYRGSSVRLAKWVEVSEVPQETDSISEAVMRSFSSEEETVMQEESPTFEEFWEAYDKKRGKPKAELLWKKLKQSEKEACMAYIPLYIEAQPDKQFRKDPQTFLRNKSWEDEIIQSAGIQCKNSMIQTSNGTYIQHSTGAAGAIASSQQSALILARQHAQQAQEAVDGFDPEERRRQLLAGIGISR